MKATRKSKLLFYLSLGAQFIMAGELGNQENQLVGPCGERRMSPIGFYVWMLVLFGKD